MQFLYWVVFVLGAALIAVCWLLYRSFVQNGRTLLRLQKVQRQLAARDFTPDVLARWQRLSRLLGVNNEFDLEGIVAGVLKHDEYGIKQERLNSWDVVIDVGANIGAFSLLCHILGSRAIFSFEPGERNFQLLKDNVGSLPGVHVFPAAVWRSDDDGQPNLTLSEAPINSGGHSVMAAGRILGFTEQEIKNPSRPGYPVASLPLDAILERFNRIKLLKLDCEGSEFPILLTSQKLDRVSRIVGEIHELGEDLLGVLDEHSRVPGFTAYKLEKLVAKLESFGFRVSTRPGIPHLYWFDARRGELARDAQADQGTSSTGLRS